MDQKVSFRSLKRGMLMKLGMPHEKPFITSADGLKIEFMHLQPHMIRIDDIIQHLSKTCRFNALVKDWYSNAEHSIMCAKRASSRYIARFALVHDFGEMITGDVLSPVKRLCPDYAKLADDVQAFMFKHFCGHSTPPDEIQEIDVRMTATEMLVLRGQTRSQPSATPYENVKFLRWGPNVAAYHLKTHFKYFFPEYKDADA